MKLIDKDSLVAEIERLLAFYLKEIEGNKEAPWAMDIAKRDILQEILSFLDTLEVKEVEEKSPVESLGISPEKYEEIVNECIYGEEKSDDKQKLASPAKTCKNDTLLDLLQKMPSYITVDGISYHFMLRKTAISYTAFYEGEGEGSGKVIFCMAGEPIELLTAMLEKLKKEGLLE